MKIDSLICKILDLKNHEETKEKCKIEKMANARKYGYKLSCMHEWEKEVELHKMPFDLKPAATRLVCKKCGQLKTVQGEVDTTGINCI